MLLAKISLLAVISLEPDTHREDLNLTRIAFGSCSKQFKSQPIWPAVLQFKPQLWLWTGDSVYAHAQGWNKSAIQGAYRAQSAQPGYRKLVKSGAIIEGVYDDHDYGLNDAGAELGIKTASQHYFLDFIGTKSARRYERAGLYSAHAFGKAPRQVKVILLDTRFHRERHFFPSLGSLLYGKIPFGALLAAMTRLAMVRLGLGNGYEGDVLGEDQWAWLEEQLSDSTATVHVVVSSIQVFTTNPLVESWGHFPKAKQRLIALMVSGRAAAFRPPAAPPLSTHAPFSLAYCELIRSSRPLLLCPFFPVSCGPTHSAYSSLVGMYTSPNS
jgi:alkaline phosphatase D